LCPRLGLVNDYIVERDFIKAIDIGVKWLRTHGFSPECARCGVPRERAHEVLATLVNRDRGINLIVKAPVITKNH